MTLGKLTDNYREKALMCEQRAIEVSDPASKQDWAELAIEWHTMANFAAKANGETHLIETA